jgi:hypothetical protein
MTNRLNKDNTFKNKQQIKAQRNRSVNDFFRNFALLHKEKPTAFFPVA